MQHIQNVVQFKDRSLAGATLVVKTSDIFSTFLYCELLIIHHHLTFWCEMEWTAWIRPFRNRKFSFTQLCSSQGYIHETLWNYISEKIVSGVTSTLLKIYPLPAEEVHGFDGFNSFYPFCSEIAPLDSRISMEYHLTWVSLATHGGTPKTLRHTVCFLQLSSHAEWVLSCVTVMLHGKKNRREIFV